MVSYFLVHVWWKTFLAFFFNYCRKLLSNNFLIFISIKNFFWIVIVTDFGIFKNHLKHRVLLKKGDLFFMTNSYVKNFRDNNSVYATLWQMSSFGPSGPKLQDGICETSPFLGLVTGSWTKKSKRTKHNNGF